MQFKITLPQVSPTKYVLLTLSVLSALTLVFVGGRLSLDDDVVLAVETDNAQNIAFFAVGDHGKAYASQMAVIQGMELRAAKMKDVSFVTFLGDNFYFDGVQSTSDPRWDDIFENRFNTPHLKGMRFFAALGNHDAMGNIQAQVDYGVKRLGSGRWRMDARYYSRIFGQTGDGQALLRVTFLDTTDLGNQAQKEYFKGICADNRALWHVVCGHHPLYSFGPHHLEPEFVEGLGRQLIEAKIALYLCGHDHNIQVIEVPGSPLNVISGAGGRNIKAIPEKRGKSLLFSMEDFGFVEVRVNSLGLKLTVLDTKAREVFDWESSR